MQSVVILVFTVISFFVAVVNWAEIRKPDILHPSIGIALVGGMTNAVSTTYVQGLRPNLFTCLYVVSFLLLVTSSGLYLAKKGRLPGLWPQEQDSAERPREQQHLHKAVRVGVGALMGVIVGLGLWRVGLRGAPEAPEFLRALGDLRAGSARLYTALLVIQSGLFEEPMYRLFAISAVAEVLNSAGVNRTPKLVAAVVVSSLLFGVIPTHNFLVSSTVGLLFGVAYLRLGLLPLIVAHCVTNAVQFPLLLRQAG